ncbi:MAG: response regulator [Chloroflexota bacterium]
MSGRRQKILIVEDDETLSRIIERNLIARGHDVVRVDTAEQALSRVVEDQPDLVLLDIMLPDRSGWDVLRRLKTYDASPRVIVVSAVRVSADRLHEFQPFAYLPKPFPLDALLRVIERAGGEESDAEEEDEFLVQKVAS